ncbi:hypothetical protein Tco_0503046 [Tanacetum coccineum]
MVRVRGMTYFEDHKWYNELADGKLKVEALMHKAKVEGSWGDATLGVMKLCAWLKSSFENFHKLDHDVLVKLEECWWKVNAHEIALFTQIMEQTTPYSFDTDDEYVAIKEHEHHSRANVDSYQAYREPFRIMDEGWLVAMVKEE